MKLYNSARRKISSSKPGMFWKPSLVPNPPFQLRSGKTEWDVYLVLYSNLFMKNILTDLGISVHIVITVSKESEYGN